MADRLLSRPARRSAQQGSTWLDVACVVAVLLAVALLLAYMALNWSTGRTNVLG